MRKSASLTVLSAGIAAAILISGPIASAVTDVTIGMPTGFMGTVSNVNFETGRCAVIGDVTWDEAWHEYKLYTFLALLIIMIIAWILSKDR